MRWSTRVPSSYSDAWAASWLATIRSGKLARILLLLWMRFERLLASSFLLVSFMLVSAVVLVAFVPWGAFYESKVSLSGALAGPSAAHLLGTDQLGRDLLTRLHEALSQTVLPLWGLVIASHGLGLAMAGGLVALGARGGWRRHVVAACRLGLGGLVSLPVGIVTFFAVVWWEEAGKEALFAALTCLLSAKFVVQLLGAYDEDRHLGYWLAHLAAGGSPFKRFLRYGVLGHWRPRLMAALTLHLQAALVVETSLSYLGFGVQEPAASLGNMLAAHFDLFLHGHYGLFLLVAVTLIGLALLPQRLR